MLRFSKWGPAVPAEEDAQEEGAIAPAFPRWEDAFETVFSGFVPGAGEPGNLGLGPPDGGRFDSAMI
jgi:hypothetical protein